jgi:hypothetical protein
MISFSPIVECGNHLLSILFIIHILKVKKAIPITDHAGL